MFPELQYDAKGNGVVNLQKEIFRRVKVKATSKSNITDFDYYNVQDGETPEMIAHKYYGDVNLHWTILVANDIVDYYNDWPMSVQKFEKFVFDKYDNHKIYESPPEELFEEFKKFYNNIDKGICYE